ncbi:hypothetical protein ABID53_002085 [Bacillus oleivorans]
MVFYWDVPYSVQGIKALKIGQSDKYFSLFKPLLDYTGYS